MNHEPYAAYEARRARCLTSHQLASFRKSPAIYRYERDNPPMGDSAAFAFGRALHTYVLEGEAAFDLQYAVGGPINPSTGRSYGTETKKFAEWAESMRPRQVLGETDYQVIRDMSDAIYHHSGACELLSSGEPEMTATGSVAGLPCQSRIDWVGDYMIADLKSCTDLDGFQRDAVKYGYVYQLTFYAELYYTEKHELPRCYLIAVEKDSPHRVGVWFLTMEVLKIARGRNMEAIMRLAECQVTDTWPTGYEITRAFSEEF